MSAAILKYIFFVLPKIYDFPSRNNFSTSGLTENHISLARKYYIEAFYIMVTLSPIELNNPFSNLLNPFLKRRLKFYPYFFSNITFGIEVSMCTNLCENYMTAYIDKKKFHFSQDKK